MNILEIENVSKKYGSLTALDNVNLCVEKGSVYGLLGPNGAGKTTLLRIINSILTHDSGSIRIAGEEAALGKTSRLLGYMPEERGLFPKMRVMEQIMFFGRLKGADKEKLKRNMKEFMDIFHISENDGRRKVEELSKGNQQKVQIIATIVHRPQLIILDEPFSGFDPINGQLLTDLIERLRESDSTIILSSHNMPAIEEMATHIGLVNKGHVLLDGKLDDIKEAHKEGKFNLTTSSPLNLPMLLDSGAVTDARPEAQHRWHRGYAYTIRRADGKRNNDILDAVAMQSDIMRFEEALPSLNEIFINAVNK